MKLRGDGKTNTVWVDGRKLAPGPSQKMHNHSPDGFSWGYQGSGPAQLALAILLRVDKEHAHQLHQRFKREVVSHLAEPGEDFETELDVKAWVEKALTEQEDDGTY